MISRVILILLAIILLPDAYFHFRYLRRKRWYGPFAAFLWWLPAATMAVFALSLAAGDDFAPHDATVLWWFLLLMGILIVPKLLYAVCSFIGFVCCRIARSRHNWGNLIGFFVALAGMGAMLYGATIGTKSLKVRQVEYTSPSLPQAFDGYRIALFSDTHLGTYGDDTGMIEKVVAAINQQKPDIICFAGDLQNMQPTELDAFQSILSQLKAPDGIFSVMGNHDYPVYIKADFATEALNESLIKSKQRSMGWHLLLNDHHTIHRQADSIVVAGMENHGVKPHPRKGDIKKALDGVKPDAFILMLQHDPAAWHSTILQNDIVPQLTLSGHTHGGQLSLFGWSPASLAHNEWRGLYNDDIDHQLYVTSGVGALVPFRLGMKPEVVVITLRKGTVTNKP